MASDPMLRESLAIRLHQMGSVKADTISELKQLVGMPHVSNSQFSKALGSLAYNSKCILLRRPRESLMEARPYHVDYRHI